MIPGPPANTASAEIVHLGDLFERIMTATVERVEHNQGLGSAVVYERIRQVRFIIITSAMARRVHGGALGVAGAKVKLPSELKNKKCCINIDNGDNLCFRYAAICLGNKTYEVDPYHSQRASSALYLQNPRGGGRCPSGWEPVFQEIVINDRVCLLYTSDAADE